MWEKVQGARFSPTTEKSDVKISKNMNEKERAWGLIMWGLVKERIFSQEIRVVT